MERNRREAQLRRLLLPVPDRLVVTIPMLICLRELRPAWRGLRVRLASGKRVADRHAMRLIPMTSIACSIRIAGKAKSRQQEREVRALAGVSRDQACPASETRNDGSMPRVASARSYFSGWSLEKIIPGSAGQLSQPLAWISLSNWPGDHPA